MLTGAQIRRARRLLHWRRIDVSRATSIAENRIAALESSDGAAWLSEAQEAALRRAFEEGGVEFGLDEPRLKGVPRR